MAERRDIERGDQEDDIEQGGQLEPYLLDRLTRDPLDPDRQTTLSVDKFKESLARDLEWIFQTRRPSDAGSSLDRFPLIASSSMYYGIEPFKSDSVIGIRPADIENMFRTAIIRFEPRIKAKTLVVRVPRETLELRKTEGSNRIELEIEGEAFGKSLRFQAVVDAAAADCKIEERHA